MLPWHKRRGRISGSERSDKNKKVGHSIMSYGGKALKKMAARDSNFFQVFTLPLIEVMLNCLVELQYHYYDRYC
jgi:hypothetical protein